MDDKDERLVKLMVDNLEKLFSEKFDDISKDLKRVIAKQDEASDVVKELSFKAKQNEEEHNAIMDMHKTNARFNELIDKRTSELEKTCEMGHTQIEKIKKDVETAKNKGIGFWLFISENWLRVVLFMLPWFAFFLFFFLVTFSPSFQIKIIETLSNLLLKGL